jgi:superfamily II DNA or RNA helicase/uncharacterized protein (UPF0332 family)
MPYTELLPKRHEPPAWPSFDDPLAVERFELAVRAHRAHTERFLLLPPVAPGGAWSVRGASGEPYQVDLQDGAGDFGTCTCPDFLYGRLGTCKHLQAAARALAGTPALARQAARNKPGPAVPVLSIQAAPELAVALLGPWTPALTRQAGLSFGPGARRPEPSETTLAFAANPPEGIRVARAVAPAIQHLLRRQRLAVRRESVLQLVQSGELGVDVLKRPLFPYQRDGVKHLLANGRALLADDMGLGKTVQAIAACEILRARGEASRILIVSPASLKHQWAGEIRAYTGQEAVVLGGGFRERREAFSSDAAYKILNYELTWKELGRLRDLDADVLVLDEAQRAKNFRTKTAATLKAIPSRFLFVLTGTPLENRLDDLYSLLQLVDPDLLGPLWQFNLAFHRQTGRGRVVGCRNLARLRERTAPLVLRRRKEEVLTQLPALTQQTRYTALTPVQMELEEGCRREASRLLSLAERRVLTPREQQILQALLLKARQACNAVELCDPERGQGSPKLDEFEAVVGEIAEQGTSKVLVFSEWTEMLKLAAARLDKLGVGWAMLHGGVPTEKRPQLLERFRADPHQRVLLSTDAGGVGLNLQVANYVIHLDLPWNPARLDQRTSRAHRLGQTRGVFVTYLCAEQGIERGIEGTLEAKRAMRSAALDLTSDVDVLDGQGFSVFLRQLKETMEAAAEPGDGTATVTATVTANAADTVAAPTPLPSRERLGEGAPPLQAPTPPTPPSVSSSPPAPSPAPSRAANRLRLARLVLENGFTGDAIKAAYDALASACAGQLDGGQRPATHPALVAALYRELIPAGRLAPAAAIALSRLHDLTTLEEHGVEVDAALAREVLSEAEAWVERMGAQG